MQTLNDLMAVIFGAAMVFAVFWLYAKILSIAWRTVKGAVKGFLNK